MFVEYPTDRANADLCSRYYKSEEHSDCTIICGPYHFKVHTLAIGAQSKYFRTAAKANTFQVCCRDDFAYCFLPFTNPEREGKTGTIELKAIEADSDDPDDACDDPEIVKLMVGYFYHLDYFQDTSEVSEQTVIEVSDSPAPQKKKQRRAAPAKRTRATMSVPSQVATPSGPKVHLIEHAKVFAMAVKYHVDALRDLAVAKFKIEVEQHWEHEDLAHAIHVIYTSTADEVTQLREVAAEALNAHRSELLDKVGIATLLRTMTGLACDLLMRDHVRPSGRRLSTKTSKWTVLCKSPNDHAPVDTFDFTCYCGDWLELCTACMDGAQLTCPTCGDKL
jgi:hypothetical protein